MGKFMKIFILVFGLIFITSQSTVFAISTPSGINEIIEELGEVEEGFEKDKWQEALEATEKIERELNEIIKQTKLKDDILVKSLANLKDILQYKNEEKAEIKYLLFQKNFFAYLNNFEFDVHPVLSLIQKYITDEAAEAAEKGDFDNVASEMAEAGNLIKHAKPILMEKGVAEQEISNFTSSIVNVIKAAKKNDASQVEKNLNQVQDLYKSFMVRAG